MPISRSARTIRTAISPRLAMRTFWNMEHARPLTLDALLLPLPIGFPQSPLHNLARARLRQRRTRKLDHPRQFELAEAPAEKFQQLFRRQLHAVFQNHNG